MQPPAAARSHHRGVIIAIVIVVAIIVVTVVWAEAPVIWPAKAGHPVELLGINRTLTYTGSYTGYVFGTIASGCVECPLVVDAGTSASVNASWLGANPDASHLNYIWVNWTIRSPYPFETVGSATEYTEHDSGEYGGPGGFQGVQLTFVIPLDTSGLPPTGTLYEWINATAY